MKKTNGTKALAAAAMGLVLVSGLAGCGGSSDGNANATPTGGNEDTRTQIRSVTVFGDSLSDVGTYKVATGDPANPGKFTVNPGKVWVENIADFYGLTLSPQRSLTMDKDASYGAVTTVGTATVLGGNNYAEGGARVVAFPSQSGIGNNMLVAPVTQQVNSYLTTHDKFPATELVIVDGGGNDTYAQFSAMCWGTDDNQIGAGNTTLTLATNAIVDAANAQVANVRKIAGKGAGAVFILAASDWSGNPFGQYYLSESYQMGSAGGSAGCNTGVRVPASQITAWTTQFNQILKAGVANLAGVVYMDSAANFADAVANPTRYGLVNVAALSM